jgi:hypothetical protein
MMKRIYSFAAMAAVSAFSLVACSDDDDKIEHFSSIVDVSQSVMSDAKYDVITVFSTDDGATFVEYPKVAVGQTYQVAARVHDDTAGDIYLTGDNCYDVDWSTSNPKPISVSNGVATFKMESVNDIAGVVVSNLPVTAAKLAGTYVVDTDDWADYHAGDELTVEVIDATHIKIVDYPATGEDHQSLIITLGEDDGEGTVEAIVESQYSGSYGGAANETTTEGGGIATCTFRQIDLELDFDLPNIPFSSSGNHLLLIKKD